jgi:hypothetical protein
MEYWSIGVLGNTADVNDLLLTHRSDIIILCCENGVKNYFLAG